MAAWPKFSINFQYKGFNVQTEVAFTTTAELDEWLFEMDSIGFKKPVYGKGSKPDAKEGVGKVTSVTPAAEKTKTGQTMYDVKVTLLNGGEITVKKFKKSEFRVGDVVRAFKNDAGYQDIDLDVSNGDFDAVMGNEGSDDIPF